MLVAICGGGTAGHVLPGLALAAELRARDPEIDVVFTGSNRGVETDLVPSAGYRLEILPSRGLERRFSPLVFLALGSAIAGIFRAFFLLRRMRPDVAVGLGGYASFAPLVAAVLLGIPSVLHEQNVIPGLANRVLARRAKKLAVSYRTTRRYFRNVPRVEVAGNPVRKKILSHPARDEAADKLSLNPRLPTVLVFGGSRGAKKVNEAVIAAWPLLAREEINLIHISGSRDHEWVEERLAEAREKDHALEYRLYPYFEEMELLYAVSDLVVSRAGATTIAELTALGLPAVLVPYPYAAAGHQLANARMLELGGGAKILPDAELTGASLANTILDLLFEEETLKRMARASRELGNRDAARRLADIVVDLSASSRSA